MNNSSKLLLVIYFFLSFTSHLNLVYGVYDSSSAVVLLTPEDFKCRVVDNPGVVLVNFFAPWCPPCKSLKPEWEKGAELLKGVAMVAAFDADASREIPEEFGVAGYPTIKVFMPGKPPIDYPRGREGKQIAEFALEQVNALVKERLSLKSTGPSESSEKSVPSASLEL